MISKEKCWVCRHEIEYDDWDFSIDIKCPNCGKWYVLECDRDDENEHIHYLREPLDRLD